MAKTTHKPRNRRAKSAASTTAKSAGDAVAMAPEEAPAMAQAIEIAATEASPSDSSPPPSPFAGTHGYAPATYGQSSSEDASHIAAMLESKRDRLRKQYGDEEAAAAGVADAPFQETHGYSPATYRRPEYLDYLEKATVAIKTVRLFVYAGMAAFVILAFYGFFLIYQLTTDVHVAVKQTVVMAEQMREMTRVMADMRSSMTTMDATITDMDGTMRNMNGAIAHMDNSLVQMGNTMTLMQHSARNLDQSIGPVMGTMNRFMPFGWGGNNYGGAPPYAPPMR